MKNIKIVLVVLCSTLLLASCNFTGVGWHNMDIDSMSGKFNYFDGVKTKGCKVNEGETVNVIVELTVEKGDLYADILDKEGNIIFTTDVSTTFEFTAEEDTKIKAKVYATKAGGSYKVTFEKQ